MDTNAECVEYMVKYSNIITCIFQVGLEQREKFI